MTKTITIQLPPMPAPRPRFSRFGTHNPKKYTDYKAVISGVAAPVFAPTVRPVELEVTFYMPIPSSLSKTKKMSMDGRHHIKRPDSDNLLKSVKDALNGIAYRDDSQVCVTKTRKIYSFEPRTTISITVL